MVFTMCLSQTGTLHLPKTEVVHQGKVSCNLRRNVGHKGFGRTGASARNRGKLKLQDNRQRNTMVTMQCFKRWLSSWYLERKSLFYVLQPLKHLVSQPFPLGYPFYPMTPHPLLTSCLVRIITIARFIAKWQS